VPLSAFHPLIADWFQERVGAPTAPQRQGWPLIQQGHHTLIAAPTGSGKTLAAFLCCLDRLLKEALAGSLPDRVDVLYISPLKALSSDVRKNLETPLAELRQRAEAQGRQPLPIRVGLRTGDTPASERQAMLRRPPHILVTTPESLYLCLTSRKARALLRAVRTVIIDEIHALVRDKRGAHLSLSLERLDALCQEAGAPPPCRVGLSATQRPIEEVARFLVGASRVAADGTPDCHILDGGHLRALDLQVCLPKDELSSVCSTAQWSDVHDQIAGLVLAHRTTLIFVSTRRLCERTAHSLVERLGEDAVCAHHGSMSRRLRQSVEERLKNGQLRAVVATASLELGIDIGAVDLVCQIGSPRAIATLLQRVGRANHRPAEGQADLLPPKGRLFALTRDELVECAALLRAIRRGEFDRIIMPRCPLDVLAQQITALCAVQPWDEDALFALCRRAYPFRDLTRADFDQVVAMLSEGVATRRGRGGAHLHRDAVNRTLRGRRGALITSVLNGGTIPEPADFEVVAEPAGATVGRLDEEWVAESSPGDIFLLGTTSWRVRAVQGGKVHVEDAHGAPPSVPFWAGEAPGRTFELSQSVSALRAELERRLAEILAACPDPAPLSALAPAVRWLIDECAIERRAAEQMAAYLAAARSALGRLPTQRDLIAERFFDEGGGMQLVLHMPLGARINRAFGLALRKRFCRSFNFELQAAATDDGVLLSLGETHSFPIETVWQFLRAQSVEHVLSQAVLGAPVFGPHFRWTAQRALAVPRRRGDGKVPPQIVRMYTEDLLAGVFPAQAACPENLPGGDIEIPRPPPGPRDAARVPARRHGRRRANRRAARHRGRRGHGPRPGHAGALAAEPPAPQRRALRLPG
jgi:ATP-dependent Lhr-like helicase